MNDVFYIYDLFYNLSGPVIFIMVVVLSILWYANKNKLDSQERIRQIDEQLEMIRSQSKCPPRHVNCRHVLPKPKVDRMIRVKHA